MDDKLKIGLFVDSSTISNWEFVMLEKIKNSDYGDIVLIVENGLPAVLPKYAVNFGMG